MREVRVVDCEVVTLPAETYHDTLVRIGRGIMTRRAAVAFILGALCPTCGADPSVCGGYLCAEGAST